MLSRGTNGEFAGVRVRWKSHFVTCSSHSETLNDVILSGGEAGARDRTTAEGSDAVERNASGACSLQDLGDCPAALHASYGPSEGYRPLQDDIFESEPTRMSNRQMSS